MADAALREKQKTLPQIPGVYLWKDGSGDVLYVGKAINLRARTSQYFGRQEDERKEAMMALARDVEFIAVDSSKEALLLEQTLIKRHRPPYNVLLADDKKYPYIAVTAEEWPRMVYTRDLATKAAYFGPFPDAGKAKRVARMLSQHFQLRQCRTLPKRECLYYHLHQCTAPCIGAVTPQAYATQAEAAKEFLSGHGEELRARLANEMAEAAKQMRFERAAELRDLGVAVESVLERQRVDRPNGDDYDAIGLAFRERRWCALVLWVRDGAVVGREHYMLNAPAESLSPDVLGAFLEQFYPNVPTLPKRVLLPTDFEGREELQTVLGELHGKRLRLEVPERGARRKFIELAEQNASLLLDQEFLLRERRTTQAMEALRDALELSDLPHHIDCFDVSHHAGQHTVASLVTFVDGQARKAGYRRFKMKSVSGGDDPAAMREAVSRRYARLLDEEGADALPDLVVIDGGRTQLGAAHEALKALGLDALPLIGLAKKREEVHRLDRLHPLRLDPADPGLHLLMRARDEAHRFAIGYQGTLKNKSFLESPLDEIDGVGPERKRRLLSTFGSLEGLEHATVDQIAGVPGMPRPLAQRIFAHLAARKRSLPPSG